MFRSGLPGQTCVWSTHPLGFYSFFMFCQNHKLILSEKYSWESSTSIQGWVPVHQKVHSILVIRFLWSLHPFHCMIGTRRGCRLDWCADASPPQADGSSLLWLYCVKVFYSSSSIRMWLLYGCSKCCSILFLFFPNENALISLKTRLSLHFSPVHSETRKL